MGEYQATALRFPCYLAEETARPRFGHAELYGSLVLSVNSGYE
jgi:hypothetical protein